MYKANSAIKIIVLVCFAALMSAFVAYRSGTFDKYIYKVETATIPDSNSFDTTGKPQMDSAAIKKIASDPEVIRMASSKSGRIINDWPARTKSNDSILKIIFKDTVKPLPADSVLKAREAKERLLMSSSKSMIIIDRPKTGKPDTVVKPVSDTVNKVLPDTAKPVRFYGSKSGIIFKPDDVKVIDKKEKKKLKKKNKTSD
jgi:hypothetical protein